MLTLALFEDSTEIRPIHEPFDRPIGTVFDTDEHGFSYLSAFLPMSQINSLSYYDGIPAAHLVVSDGSFRVWEGRIEDRRIVTGGLEIGAFGYWRSFYDADYSAMWTTQDIRLWRVVSRDDVSGRRPERWQMTKDDASIFTHPVKNEAYGAGTNGGGWYIEVPHNGEEDITNIDFDYDITLPSSDWRVRTAAWTADFAAATVEDTITGTGANQTGTKNITLTAARPIVEILTDNSASGSYTDNTGTHHVKISNIRIKTTTSSNVYGDEIAKALVTYINGINSTQLSSVTSLVDSPTVDISEAIYEDVKPAKILIELASMGDNSTPPEQYEVGVWENQQLYFRQRGSQAQDWYVDLADISVNSTLDTMYNSAYATYRLANGKVQRTAVSDDDTSQTQYGITRRVGVRTNESDSASATTWRDARLERTKDITPRARVIINRWVQSASGARVPAFHCRSGDSLTIRGLPVTGSSLVDKIRKFTIARTSYSCDDGLMTITPELDLPDLPNMVARLAADAGPGGGPGFERP